MYWSDARGQLRLLLVAVMTLAMAACSGVRPYTDSSARNLTVKVQTDPNSLFSRVDASVDIYSVGEQCQTEYRGTVALRDPVVSLGLPTGGQSYLVFAFDSSAFLGGVRGSIAFDTLLEPKPDHHYDVNVRYLDEIYSVEIFEKPRRAQESIEVAPRELVDCH